MRFFTLITAMAAAAALVAAPALAGERDGRNRDPYAGYRNHSRSHSSHYQRSVTQRSVTIRDNVHGNRNVVERSITRTSPQVIPNTELRITRTVPQGSAFVRPGEPVRYYRADRLGDVSRPYRTDGYISQSWAERYRSHHGKDYGNNHNGAYIIRRDGVHQYHADRIHGLSQVRRYTYPQQPSALRYDRFNDRWHYGKYNYNYHVRPYPFRSHFDRHHSASGLKLHLHFSDRYDDGVGVRYHHRSDVFDSRRFKHHGFDHDKFRHHRGFRDHKSFRHHGKHHRGHDSGVRLHLSF